MKNTTLSTPQPRHTSFDWNFIPPEALDPRLSEDPPGEASDEEVWRLIRASRVPQHRAIALARDHGLGDSPDSRSGSTSVVDALLAEILPTDKATVTVPEAGRLLGLGAASSYAAARRDEIPVLRFGSRVVVPLPALRHLLETGHPICPDEDAAAIAPLTKRKSSLRNRTTPVRVISP